MIRLSKSCLSDPEKKAVMAVLDREYLGMGAEVQQFEKLLSNFFGRSTVCVSSGTSALQLALQSCGIGRGDEVLVPTITYIASFQAISATGAKPVACDVDKKTLLLDLNDAKKRLSNSTKAIMPVHYSGGVGDLEAVYNFSNKNKLRVIEDAAHAFGTKYKEKLIGSFGDVACFSFDGIKNITSGEGGCVVTDNEIVIQKVKDARLLGVEKDSDKRYSNKRSWDFDSNEQGWRYHMSNIMAAIGIEQFKRLSEFSVKRQNLAIRYDQILSNHKIIQILSRDYKTVVPHIYVIRIAGMKNRSDIQRKLLDEGIQVGYHYQPNHLLSFYKRDDVLPFPNAESIFPELMSLPLHPDLSKIDIEYVCTKLNEIVEEYVD